MVCVPGIIKVCVSDVLAKSSFLILKKGQIITQTHEEDNINV